MTNGKCPTWFIVKWLEKHPTHTAKAPKTTSKRSENMPSMFCPTYRSDWTIYNERGKRVRFKRKPKLTHVGKLESHEFLAAHDSSTNGWVSDMYYNSINSIVDVFIQERSR